MRHLNERSRQLLDGDDRNIWTDEAGVDANRHLSRFIESYGQGNTHFPDAEELWFSCCVLAGLADMGHEPATRRLVGLLDANGVTFSQAYPLAVEFHRRATDKINRPSCSIQGPTDEDLF